MKNKLSNYRNLIRAIIVIAMALLLALYICSKVIVFDRSETRVGNDLVWNDTTYVRCSGSHTEGKRIAQTEDGYDIIEIKEDPTHTFIVLRNFLDQQLMVDKSYEIPKSGIITSASWNYRKITDEEFCRAVSEIIEKAETDFEYVTEGIFMLTESQKMRELHVGYNDCPISTEYIGYMGTVRGRWYITTEISNDRNNPDGSPKEYKVSCYTIPDEYLRIISEYWQ